MTEFVSPIVLGGKYVDARTDIVGYASYIGFNENGCVEVGIEHSHADSNGKVEISVDNINELRLSPAPGERSAGEPVTYESDVVLGRKYRDRQTGLEGWACVIDFHERQATRVTIRSIGYDKDGSKVLKYHGLDDFLLVDIETEEPARRKDEKRSPVTQEVSGPR